MLGSLYTYYSNLDLDGHMHGRDLVTLVFVQLAARLPLFPVYILFLAILYVLPHHPYNLVTYEETYALLTICFFPVFLIYSYKS